MTQANLDYAAVREYYNRTYYKDTCDSQGMIHHYRRLARRFQPWVGKRLLDVGCGAGMWLKAAAELGACPTGIDISQKAVEACHRTLPHAELYCGPAEQLPFNDRLFDFVSCLGALEHFLDPQAALREMIRVSRPDALFLLLVPNAGFLPRRLGLYSGTEQVAVREHVRSLRGWQELFQAAGLSVRSRWKDLHVLSVSWIMRGAWYFRAIRLAVALALTLWPLSCQYQVYHLCNVKK
jgi:2-polyprenyl-3-methyl-5-hydroxy-6-metoxy-1,4-benzoquinol methylase